MVIILIFFDDKKEIDICNGIDRLSLYIYYEVGCFMRMQGKNEMIVFVCILLRRISMCVCMYAVLFGIPSFRRGVGFCLVVYVCTYIIEATFLPTPH